MNTAVMITAIICAMLLAISIVSEIGDVLKEKYKNNKED